MPKFGPCRYLIVEISKPWKVPFYMGYRRWRLARDGGSPGNYVIRPVMRSVHGGSHWGLHCPYLAWPGMLDIAWKSYYWLKSIYLLLLCAEPESSCISEIESDF
jgi:hypothetical protein